MNTYKVKHWPVIDDDGNRHEAGETVELSDEKARFYSGRLIEVESENDNNFASLPEDTEFPYHYGSGWYFLSNGEKVRGEDNAIEAQGDLNEQSNER